MSKKKDHTENGTRHQLNEDQSLFRQAVADVRPLKADKRVRAFKNLPLPRPLQFAEGAENAKNKKRDVNNLMSDPVELDDITISDSLFYASRGIQLKLQRKLRRGEFSIEAELDLHGYTAAEAKIAIHKFFTECKIFNKRCIRIIHGKGYRSQNKIPVLKTYVAHWLKQRDDVMAYSSAQPVDGGTGALYVLLKLKR